MLSRLNKLDFDADDESKILAKVEYLESYDVLVVQKFIRFLLFLSSANIFFLSVCLIVLVTSICL